MSINLRVLLAALLITAPLCAESPVESFQMVRSAPGLSLHKEMFMLPVTLCEEYDGSQTEAVFQISAKHQLFDTRIYFAYTQISFWQAYDHNNSAPFRETNYNPELFYRTKHIALPSAFLGADIGFEHESNGQRPPISRSWNLLYFSPYYSRNNFLLHLKVRYRFPEDQKKNPLDALGDDNPDITDFLGYADLQIFYRFPWRHVAHVMLRGNPGKGRGEIIMSYSVPIPKSEISYFIVRVWNGYGESLVDYNRPLTRIGLGVMFSH
ncbi:Outer membrAne phospholipase a [Candidatus Zixiibacteriota bacterium]|nr:Outer membrAne phospholipase a [candidate division Zixibacteria bacterium]